MRFQFSAVALEQTLPVKVFGNRLASPADGGWIFPRFRNSGNVIEKPRGRRQLQAVASLPPARQPGRARRCRTAGRNKELNPSEIARAVGRSVQRASTVLGALRLAEVVRYDTDGKRNLYRL